MFQILFLDDDSPKGCIASFHPLCEPLLCLPHGENMITGSEELAHERWATF